MYCVKKYLFGKGAKYILLMLASCGIIFYFLGSITVRKEIYNKVMNIFTEGFADFKL